jgi:hypothetical protein
LSEVSDGSCTVKVTSSFDEVGTLKTRDNAGMAEILMSIWSDRKPEDKLPVRPARSLSLAAAASQTASHNSSEGIHAKALATIEVRYREIPAGCTVRLTFSGIPKLFG